MGKTRPVEQQSCRAYIFVIYIHRVTATRPVDSNRVESDSVRVHVSVRPFGCCLTTSRYLVDPASSHMLVSKIKPCMSKYK